MARILILEDDSDLSELYRMTLQAEGHEVTVFDDPGEALARAAASPAPEVIVLDERLGALSGLEALPALKKAYPAARVLVATADPDAVESAVSKGGDRARKKPFAMKTLVDEVRKLLKA
jgi:DNA-binding NtrC family response regulator